MDSIPCQTFGLSNKNGIFVILQFTENYEIFLNDPVSNLFQTLCWTFFD